MISHHHVTKLRLMKNQVKSPKLKRRSTRHVSEITAIASEFGNSAKIIVPSSWLGKRVIAFLYSEYISAHHHYSLSFNTIDALDFLCNNKD
jgi:hypothetical protein